MGAECKIITMTHDKVNTFEVMRAEKEGVENGKSNRKRCVRPARKGKKSD